MKLVWSAPSLADLSRLHRFLAVKNRRAATDVLRALRAGANKLLEHPRLGERTKTSSIAETRRIFIDDYELRYEVRADNIFVLRIWHTREER